MKSKTCSLSVVLLLLSAGVSSAALMAVTNPSFETPVLSDGGVDWDIDSWDESNDTINMSVTSSWNPTVSHFPDGVPDGNNVGSIFRSGWIVQPLSVQLAANTRYTLQVSVGRLAGNEHPEGFVGIGVALPPNTSHTIWSGSPLAFYDLAGLNLDPGEFDVATVVYESPASSNDIGEDLWIYLVNSPGSSPVQTAFDNVELDATPVPSPSTVSLLGLGVIAFIGSRRKK